MTKITPVLLAGGTGTRLWPLSRKSYPKQFSNIAGTTSLFQQTAMRLQSSQKINFGSPITLTNNDFRFVIGEQLQSINLELGQIIIEPEGRNTAPAILLASLLTLAEDENSILLVAPSDHLIVDVQGFHQSVAKGIPAVKAGNILTFGVKPSRPETGFGYLQTAATASDETLKVVKFHEKPSIETANKMLSDGDYLWNSGIFMFRAFDMIEAFKQHEPEMLDQVQDALAGSHTDLDFLRLNVEQWSKVQNISIDYAIMEHVKNVVTVPIDVGWSDLGGWNAVWALMEPDENGVAASKNATVIDCENVLVRSEDPDQRIVAVGVKDLVAIAMRDAVMVCDKKNLDQIRQVTQILKSEGVKQAEEFSKDHRPWGWYETLVLRERFQVKRIHVNEQASLSLQSHHHRSEHWIVVQGTAEVTVENDVSLITEGESVYIPLGSKHRLRNPGKVPMVLIEVQTGAYLEEDDIVRYDDLYNRETPK